MGFEAPSLFKYSFISLKNLQNQLILKIFYIISSLLIQVLAVNYLRMASLNDAKLNCKEK
jgi:hypothetical protein